MTRSDLVDRLALRHPTLTAADHDQIVRLIFDTIAGQLVAGGGAELRGFGSFFTRAREGRNGRNPSTGEAVEVPPTRIARFKAGKGLRQKVEASRTIAPDL